MLHKIDTKIEKSSGSIKFEKHCISPQKNQHSIFVYCIYVNTFFDKPIQKVINYDTNTTLAEFIKKYYRVRFSYDRMYTLFQLTLLYLSPVHGEIKDLKKKQ